MDDEGLTYDDVKKARDTVKYYKNTNIPNRGLDSKLQQYLDLDEQIKQLQEKQKLLKDDIELTMMESDLNEFNCDYGRVKISTVKGAKRINKKLAEQYLTEEQLEQITKQGADTTRVTIMSKDALERQQKFLEGKKKSEGSKD